MKLLKQILILTTCIIISIPIMGQGVYFNNLYDNAYNFYNTGNSVVIKDSTYIVVGNSKSYNSSCDTTTTDLFSIDINGNLQWENTYNIFYQSNGYVYNQYSSLVVTYDSGLAIVTNMSSCMIPSGGGGSILKLNKNGDILWIQGPGGVINDIILTHDMGYVITGTSWFSDGINYYPTVHTLFGLDSLGNYLWGDTIGMMLVDSIYDTYGINVKHKFDGGYIMFGMARDTSNSVFERDLFILKVDSIGNYQWDTIIVDSGMTWINGVIQTKDGNYLLYGAFNGNGFTKLDTTLNILWQKTYSGGISKLRQLSDSSFIGLGPFWNSGMLIKFNSSLDSIWSRTYINGYFRDIQQTTDGGFIITGESNGDMWLVKTNCLGFDAPPQAAFTYTSADSNIYFFTNQSQYIGDHIWFFGDGNNSTELNPIHIYTDTGIYIITLIVSSCGDTSIYSDTIVILNCNLIQANIYTGQDTFNIGETVNFYDSSSFASQWYWFFGDGETDTIQHPIHVYDSAGIYLVTLIVTYESCIDTATKIISISNNVGIEENIYTNNALLKIYPNPFSNTATIQYHIPKNKENSMLSIYDAIGKIIITYKISPKKRKVVINTKNMNNGVYWFVLKVDDVVAGIRKLILLK